MTFELGLLECCRQHKVLVADLLRNCTIAIPLGEQTPQVSFSLKQPQKYSQPCPKNRICEMKIYQNE